MDRLEKIQVIRKSNFNIKDSASDRFVDSWFNRIVGDIIEMRIVEKMDWNQHKIWLTSQVVETENIHECLFYVGKGLNGSERQSDVCRKYVDFIQTAKGVDDDYVHTLRWTAIEDKYENILKVNGFSKYIPNEQYFEVLNNVLNDIRKVLKTDNF